jgi:hypothetical protein
MKIRNQLKPTFRIAPGYDCMPTRRRPNVVALGYSRMTSASGAGDERQIRLATDYNQGRKIFDEETGALSDTEAPSGAGGHAHIGACGMRGA